jgi:hypothetical protein
VPVWELTCEAHERWVLGDDKQKIIEWEPDGQGGGRMVKVSPIHDGWSRTIEGIPLTPDQIRADARRNSMTRRAEQAALQQGVSAMAEAYDHQPTTKELLRARQFAGKATAACPSCFAPYVAGASFCPDCGVRVAAVVTVALEPATEPAEA